MPTQTGPQVSYRSPEFKVIKTTNMTSNATPLEAAMSPELNLMEISIWLRWRLLSRRPGPKFLILSLERYAVEAARP
jgi:hypothetical protein